MNSALASWSGRKLVISAIIILLSGGLLVYSTTRPDNIVARMSAEDAHMAVFRRYTDEAWNQGSVAMLSEVLTADHVRHEVGTDFVGMNAVSSLITNFRTAIPDLYFDIRDIAADGDRVWAYLVGSGIQIGSFALPDGTSVPPTGAPVAIQAILISRFVDGKIAETWVEYDNWLQQTGVVPSMQQVATEARNRAVVQRVIDDLWNGERLESVNELYAMPFTSHNSDQPSETVTLGRFRKQLVDFRNVFPDLRYTIHDMIVRDDQVIVHYTAQGTHEGQGLVTRLGIPIPPSGEVVTWDGVVIYRIQDEKIVEEWEYWDNEYFTRAEYGLSN